MSLPGISAVMMKLQFGDELGGYILCDSGVSHFPKPCRFLRSARAMLTLDSTYNFPLSKLFYVNQRCYYLLSIEGTSIMTWRKPHLSRVSSLNLYSDKDPVHSAINNWFA